MGGVRGSMWACGPGWGCAVGRRGGLGGGGGAGGGAGGGGGGGGDHGSLMHVSRLPVYVWDAGAVPFGLREDAVGAVGRAVARAANRCAIGTSVMRRLAGLAS